MFFGSFTPSQRIYFRMKEPILYKNYNNYFRETLDFLNKEFDAGAKIPDTTEQEIEFEIKEPLQNRNIGYKFPWIIKKDYSKFILKKWDLLKELQSYKMCLQHLKDKGYMKDYFGEQGFLLNTIITFAKETNDLQFIQEKFDEIYKGIEDFIFTDLIKFSCSALLFSFESDIDEIIIDEFTKIKKYSENECKEIWERRSFITSSWYIISPLDYRLEVIFNKKKEDLRKFTKEGREDLRKVLLLLRLFKPSTLRIGRIETKPIQWVSFGGIISSGMEERPGGNYRLSIAEVPELIKLWNEIKNINFLNFRSLEIAIKRFNFAHERIDLEDKFIDIMIGFETLYLADDKELRYKSGLRTAILIGENLEERRKIFKIIQVAYDKRSNLIHGGRLEEKVRISDPVNQEYTMNAFIDIIKDYLSSSIKTFVRLSANYKHGEILNKIHESTLTAGIILE